MKRLITAMTAGIACLALATSAALAQGKPEKADITIGLPVTTSTFLPLYLAQQQGYFKSEGLNVKIIAFHGGTDLVRGMIAGAVDVGVTSLAGVTVGIKAGQPLRVFYGGFNMAVFDWYAVKSIKSMADTKGKRFGISRIGSSTDLLTRYALKVSGVDPKSVKIVQGGGSNPRLAAMDAGQIDVNIFAPPQKFIAADKGYNLHLPPERHRARLSVPRLLLDAGLHQEAPQHDQGDPAGVREGHPHGQGRQEAVGEGPRRSSRHRSEVRRPHLRRLHRQDLRGWAAAVGQGHEGLLGPRPDVRQVQIGVAEVALSRPDLHQLL